MNTKELYSTGMDKFAWLETFANKPRPNSPSTKESQIKRLNEIILLIKDFSKSENELHWLCNCQRELEMAAINLDNGDPSLGVNQIYSARLYFENAREKKGTGPTFIGSADGALHPQSCNEEDNQDSSSKK